jgi:hypothetical protein
MFSKEGGVFMTLPQKLEKTDLTFGVQFISATSLFYWVYGIIKAIY